MNRLLLPLALALLAAPAALAQLPDFSSPVLQIRAGSPEGDRFIVDDLGGLMARGWLGYGTLMASGSGTRMMWYPHKASFRFGDVNGAQWDHDNTGFYSFAGGSNTTASGLYAFAHGHESSATGNSAVALGSNNAVSGAAGFAVGGSNTCSANFCVALGLSNTVSMDHGVATGWNNDVSGAYSFAAGRENDVSLDYAFATGWNNAVSGTSSFTAGRQNAVSGAYSAATGRQNVVSGDYGFAAGLENVCSASHCISLGYRSRAEVFGAVAIGFRAVADANYAVAIGYGANTNGHRGAFVISDQSTADSLEATADHQFMSRYAGGYRLYTNSAATVGVSLSAGGNSWNVISDRNAKEAFAGLDAEALLQRLARLPLSTWRYRDAGTEDRHVGPMAQDWHRLVSAPLGLNGDSLTINQGDFDGVNLAGIVALEARTRALAEENDALRAEVDALRGGAARVAALEAEVTALRAERAADAARFARLEAAVARLAPEATGGVTTASARVGEGPRP